MDEDVSEEDEIARAIAMSMGGAGGASGAAAKKDGSKSPEKKK